MVITVYTDNDDDDDDDDVDYDDLVKSYTKITI